MSEYTEPCKNYEFCEKQTTGCGGCSICPKDLCMNCGMMFGKELIFKNDVECSICLETKRGIKQPKCEHATTCVQCFRDCYYGKDYDELDFPYSNDVEEEYDEYGGLDYVPKSFIDRYPLIYEYEEESNRRFDKQQEMISVNSRCPLCRS